MFSQQTTQISFCFAMVISYHIGYIQWTQTNPVHFSELQLKCTLDQRVFDCNGRSAIQTKLLKPVILCKFSILTVRKMLDCHNLVIPLEYNSLNLLAFYRIAFSK